MLLEKKRNKCNNLSISQMIYVDNTVHTKNGYTFIKRSLNELTLLHLCQI